MPSSDSVTIVILANDNAAGVVGFHPDSRSIVAREGGFHLFGLHIQHAYKYALNI